MTTLFRVAWGVRREIVRPLWSFEALGDSEVSGATKFMNMPESVRFGFGRQYYMKQYGSNACGIERVM